MRTVVVRNGARIPLGKQGENNAVRVVWPGIAEKYAKLYGDGRFELVVVQNGKVYPAVVNVDGADLIWNVLAADVAIAEIGSLELIYYVGDTIAKSQTWETFVEVSKSAEGTTEPPEPAKNWVDVVINTASDAKQSATESAESARQSAESATNAAASATKAENAVGHSPIVGENGNWFVWDFEKSEYVDSGKPSSTPPITPDTAGKYLTNDGSKAEWGEVNGTLRVNLNKNSNDEWIIDKTFGEIEKAINDGQVVYVVDMFNKPTISGTRGYRTFYYDSYSSPSFGGDFYMFVSSSYGEIRFLNIYFNQVYVHDIGVNAVLGEEVSSNDVLKLGDHGINAATPNIDYALPVLYVTITQDGQDSDGNPIYKSDKTYEEIKAAHEAGREVYARIYFNFWCFLRISEVNTVASRITFFSITMSLSGFSPTSMMIPIDYITLFVTDKEGTDFVECERYELYVPTQTFTPELLNIFLSFRPEAEQELNEEQQEIVRKRLSAEKAVPVTTADNGKFLRVVNGQWAAAEITNANEVSF